MNCKDCKYSHDTGTALLCWGQRFAPPVDADDWCEGWKPRNVTPQTNYDRIVSMTPEKLAGWLCQTQYREGDFCPPKHGLRYCQMADGCRVCWLSWLESPAEVDNG